MTQLISKNQIINHGNGIVRVLIGIAIYMLYVIYGIFGVICSNIRMIMGIYVAMFVLLLGEIK